MDSGLSRFAFILLVPGLWLSADDVPGGGEQHHSLVCIARKSMSVAGQEPQVGQGGELTPERFMIPERFNS